MLVELLEDLCIFWLKIWVMFGVDLFFDMDFVIYVWFDVFVNYLINIGWLEDGYQDWWVECEYMIGKDILKLYGVYWLLMLMVVDLLLLKKLFVYSYWVGVGGVKMLKFIGNVVDLIEVMDKFGVDVLCWFLVCYMCVDSDSQIFVDLIIQVYNYEFGNKIGNLLFCVVKFFNKNFDGKVLVLGELMVEDQVLWEIVVVVVKLFVGWVDLVNIFVVV